VIRAASCPHIGLGAANFVLCCLVGWYSGDSGPLEARTRPGLRPAALPSSAGSASDAIPPTAPSPVERVILHDEEAERACTKLQAEVNALEQHRDRLLRDADLNRLTVELAITARDLDWWIDSSKLVASREQLGRLAHLMGSKQVGACLEIERGVLDKVKHQIAVGGPLEGDWTRIRLELVTRLRDAGVPDQFLARYDQLTLDALRD
jgi:hypothetical protein